MTTDLRTAAIEAASEIIRDEMRNTGSSLSAAESVVDAVLPLLAAGTASRIAAVIEAERDKPQKSPSSRQIALSHAATIARRVGETS